ncbi:uncharacterized protein [Littorina saxatilis]|uniref:uncharacterized protein n=1 Tax=Littorina saxatilis TaxID=31220 RepID=UPI0038B452C1
MAKSDYMTVKGTLSGQGGGFNIGVSIGPNGRHPKKTKYELDSVEKDLPADLKLTDNLVAELSGQGKENLVSQLASGSLQEQSFRLENNNGFIHWELKNENGSDPLRVFVAVYKVNRESGKKDSVKQFLLEVSSPSNLIIFA